MYMLAIKAGVHDRDVIKSCIFALEITLFL